MRAQLLFFVAYFQLSQVAVKHLALVVLDLQRY